MRDIVAIQNEPRLGSPNPQRRSAFTCAGLPRRIDRMRPRLQLIGQYQGNRIECTVAAGDGACQGQHLRSGVGCFRNGNADGFAGREAFPGNVHLPRLRRRLWVDRQQRGGFSRRCHWRRCSRLTVFGRLRYHRSWLVRRADCLGRGTAAADRKKSNNRDGHEPRGAHEHVLHRRSACYRPRAGVTGGSRESVTGWISRGSEFWF